MPQKTAGGLGSEHRRVRVLCTSSSGTRQLEPQAGFRTEHRPLSPWSPVRGSLFIATVSEVCVPTICKSQALNYIHRFSVFHFKHRGTIIGYAEAPFTQLFLNSFFRVNKKMPCLLTESQKPGLSVSEAHPVPAVGCVVTAGVSGELFLTL